MLHDVHYAGKGIFILMVTVVYCENTFYDICQKHTKNTSATSDTRLLQAKNKKYGCSIPVNHRPALCVSALPAQPISPQHHGATATLRYCDPGQGTHPDQYVPFQSLNSLNMKYLDFERGLLSSNVRKFFQPTKDNE